MKSILNVPSKSGVYLIKNTVTGDSYIGSAVNMRTRCNAHRSQLNNNKHANIHIQRSYVKYGAGNFIFKVLAFIDVAFLIKEEQRFIDELKPTFNIRIVCETSRGVTLSDETRKRMSLAKKGKPLSVSASKNLENIHKNRVGKPVFGKVKDCLKLWPASLAGKTLSLETKVKIAASKLGKKFNKEARKYELPCK